MPSEAGEAEQVFDPGAALLRTLADSPVPAPRRARVRPQIARVAVAALTRVQRDGISLSVAAARMRGASQRWSVAARLYLSPKTVEKHVASLMDRLEVRTWTQLAAQATANTGQPARVKWGNSRP